MPNVACISDIHGNLLALKAVLADIRSIGGDLILCAGDLVGYGPFPNEVIDEIKSQNIQTVIGNYDEAVGFKLPVCGCHIDDPVQKRYSDHALKWAIDHTSAQSREYLRSLPEQLSLDVSGKKLLIVHASADSLNEYIYATDEERIADLLVGIEEDFYVYGHTHFPYIKKRADKLIVNAGSVGRPKQGDTRASYALLEINPKSVHACIRKVAYDVEQTANDIIAKGLDPYFAEFLLNGGKVKPGECDADHSCGCEV